MQTMVGRKLLALEAQMDDQSQLRDGGGSGGGGGQGFDMPRGHSTMGALEQFTTLFGGGGGGGGGGSVSGGTGLGQRRLG